MIYHKNQVLRLTANTDLSANEGCFVSVSAGVPSLTTASTAPTAVFGLIDHAGEADSPVDIILPGHSGLVGVSLHSSGSAVAPGDRLALAANGSVKKASSGTIVAIAMEPANPGALVMARLVEPYSAS